MNSKFSGALAEMQAHSYLSQQGYIILQSNFHCRAGEIDLIALQDEEVVFVEVKSANERVQESLGEAITLSKLRKLSKTVTYWLNMNPQFLQHSWRLDALLITLKSDGTLAQLEHLQNIEL